MNKLILISVVLFIPLFAIGQNNTIIESLNSDNGSGKVLIYQDDAIKNMLGSTINVSSATSNISDLEIQLSTTKTTNSSTNYVKAKGYRIQVFSGSDQKKSKKEAQARKKYIEDTYPNMNVLILYSSPVWRVKAGDFKTMDEAKEALIDMKAKLPAFGREFRIIEDAINVPVN